MHAQTGDWWRLPLWRMSMVVVKLPMCFADFPCLLFSYLLIGAVAARWEKPRSLDFMWSHVGLWAWISFSQYELWLVRKPFGTAWVNCLGCLCLLMVLSFSMNAMPESPKCESWTEDWGPAKDEAVAEKACLPDKSQHVTSIHSHASMLCRCFSYDCFDCCLIQCDAFLRRIETGKDRDSEGSRDSSETSAASSSANQRGLQCLVCSIGLVEGKGFRTWAPIAWGLRS